MRREEVEMWTSDHNQYLFSTDDDNEYDNSSVRNIALSNFSSLIERFGDDAVKAVMVLADEAIFGASSQDSQKLFSSLMSNGTSY